jgi:hypothetical protein
MPDPDGCTATISSLSFSGTSFTGKNVVLEDLDADDNVTYLRRRYTEQ